MTQAAIASLLLGDSVTMCRLRGLIARVAPNTLPVLIEGPTGAGKELVARAIHGASGRPGQLVAFNVCAIPDTMFEDALFGHVRGAFTGAVHDSPGFLMQAHQGTAFLDEVSGLPLGAQAKLLRSIEERSFRPVGARRDASSDFRIVAATNESLEHLQERGAFREDLRHRFGKLVLRVPPLAERREDIPLLTRHFLLQCGTARRTDISPRAMDRLQAHDWPGNVRELRAVIEAVSVLAPNHMIEVEDVAPLLHDEATQPLRVRLSFELQRTLEVVRECRGDVYAAAALLGVNPTTVYRRLRRAQLAAHQLRGDAGTHGIGDTATRDHTRAHSASP